MSHYGYISAGYIDIAKKFRSRDIEIGPKALTILGYFATNDKISTYQIFLDFQHSSKTAYKNIHKTVQRLYNLGLVSITKQKDAQHGAKYYRISEEGIFYLFLRYDKFEQGIFELYHKYDKSHSWVESSFYKCFILGEGSTLFQCFVYTYFNRETFLSLEALDGEEGERNAREAFVWNVANYLQNCCRDVNEFLRWLERPKWPTFVEDWPERKYLLNLIDSLIPSFSYFDKPEKSTKEYDKFLNVLLKDNKFATVVEFVYQDLKKGYESYMNLRSKSD